jgi:hypothetical protein
MRRRLLMAATIVVTMLTTGGPARAGGASWFGPEHPYHAVGDHLSIRAAFWSGGFEGTVSQGPYYAYLVPQYQWLPKGPIPANAIPLGPITIAPATGKKGERVATLTFTVPDVDPGRYSIDYCNRPCTVEGVGDLHGSSFWIGDTEEEARLAARVNRLEVKARQLSGKNREIRALEARLAAAEEERADLINQLRIAALQRASTAERDGDAAQSRQSVFPWGLAVALTVALLGVWYRRRLGRHVVPEVVPDELVREVRDSQVPSRQPMTSLGRPVMSMPAPPLTKS